ncbi:hypothetical protein TNCT_590941 [Trichonephila clavata]|uniref:Uncharacterized protein n=1 Tax=Trichonephila clavata TaxID=2740835 RepID=A0A8X6L2R0_TRICU|nr:hypothetical protein TNCT_590941 [Trichonephila clavata]
MQPKCMTPMNHYFCLAKMAFRLHTTRYQAELGHHCHPTTRKYGINISEYNILKYLIVVVGIGDSIVIKLVVDGVLKQGVKFCFLQNVSNVNH